MVRCPGDQYEVPDYRIYKVEDSKELTHTQNRLSKLGLKDPWLRNEVWRYNSKEFGTEGSRLKKMVFRGFKIGFFAFVITEMFELLLAKHGTGRKGPVKQVCDEDRK